MRFLAFGLLLAHLALAGTIALAAEGEDPAAIGEAIFRRGEAMTLEEVQIGDPPSSAPIEFFPCQGCHQEDGKGTQEGGVVAPNISWSYLSKPYSVRGGPFNLRPAYDERLFARALRHGVDSAGRRFGMAMPRYALSDGEIAGLLAFLRRLDEGEKASTFGTEIPLGVRLPAARQQAEVLQAVLEAYFARVNSRGGIFGRQVSLRFYAPSEIFEAGLAAGLDLSIPASSALRPTDEVPVLALFATDGVTEHEPVAKRFELYSGPEDRAPALERFARLRLGIGEGEILKLPADGALPKKAPPSRPRALLYDGQDAAALRRALAELPAKTVLLLGRWLESPELMDLAQEQERPVYVATPPTPQLASREGQTLYAQLNAFRPLPTGQKMAQLWALAAAETLTAALEQAGRDLRPQALVTLLEGFSQVETGFGPPLRFSAARHLGARGASILRLDDDPARGPNEKWIEIEDPRRDP